MEAPRPLNKIEIAAESDPAADSGKKQSEIVKSVTTNYGICEANSNQLLSLQEYVKGIFKIYP